MHISIPHSPFSCGVQMMRTLGENFQLTLLLNTPSRIAQEKWETSDSTTTTTTTMRVVWLSLTFFARCSAGPSTNNDLSVLFVCLVLWAISPARRRERREKEKEKRMKWNDAGGGRTYCSLILAVKWSAALLPPPAELSAMLAHTWNIHITPFWGDHVFIKGASKSVPSRKEK